MQLEGKCPKLEDENANWQKLLVEGNGEPGNIHGKFDKILCELEELKREKESLSAQVSKLEEQNSFLTEAMLQHQYYLVHQYYLEKLELDKRAENLIVLGVPEESISAQGSQLECDETKFATILKHIGLPYIQYEELKRIGKEGNRQQRPILVKLKVKSDRKNILENLKKLKSADGVLSKIYLKKDIDPPAIRKEYKRLHEIRKEEESQPENIGRRVSYDSQCRVVLVDDITVDRFKPIFF